MASIQQLSETQFRVSYSLRLPSGRVRRVRGVKSKDTALQLKYQLEQLERAVLTGMATMAQINDWVGRHYLTAAEVHSAFPQAEGYKAPLEKTNLKELLKAYETHAMQRSKAHDASRRTHQNRMSVARLVLDWIEKEHPSLVITRKDIEAWLMTMLHLAPETRRHRLSCLRIFLDLAQEMGMVHTNAADEVRIQQQRPQIPRRILSGDEIQIVLQESIGYTAVLQGCMSTVVRLGLYAGLRSEEMAWLAWSAIDLERGLLRVQQTEDPAGARWQPKDSEVRIIDLKASLIDRLQRERERQRSEGMLGMFIIVVRRGGSGEPTGRPAHSTTLTYGFHHFCGHLRLDPRITLYSLRHTYCTSMLRAGVDIETVRERMGHSRLATTQQYLHAIKPESHPSDALPY